jgi:hypothetical protein
MRRLLDPMVLHEQTLLREKIREMCAPHVFVHTKSETLSIHMPSGFRREMAELSLQEEVRLLNTQPNLGE